MNLNTELIQLCTVLLEKLVVIQSRNCHLFMETRGLIPCSQVPSTGPYLDKIDSLCFFQIYFNIFSCTPGLQSGVVFLTFSWKMS
jgi:hypothetical protein